MEEQLLNDFKENAIFRLNESLRMIKIAMDSVDDAHLWKAPFPKGMTLGNQLLHCCGNMTQYIIAGLGNTVDNRERENEFEVYIDRTLNDLLKNLEATVATSIETIEKAPNTSYTHHRHIQGFYLSGMGAVFHAVEHFSYHTGQIAFWIKQQTGKDLGFYAQHNLNQLNT